MKLLNISSNSSTKTIEIAKILAKYLSIGDTVVLTGELGSGKTKFTEGFLSFFGLEDEISSPTFNIVNEYKSNAVNIYHFDVYRLADAEEFYAIGGEEYFEKGICLIEWGELIDSALPFEYIHIFFKKSNNNVDERLLTLKAIGNKYETILEQLKEELNWKF